MLAVLIWRKAWAPALFLLRLEFRARFDVARQLFEEPVARRQTPAEILHEALEPLRTFGAGSGL